MRDEIIMRNGHLLRADHFKVPDARWVGVLLTEAEAEVVNYAYDKAVVVHGYILERDMNGWQESFLIDVPNLDYMGKAAKLVPSARAELWWLETTFKALVRHFFTKYRITPYTYDDKVIHGYRYSGLAYTSKLS